jgi:hypothetical protein
MALEVRLVREVENRTHGALCANVLETPSLKEFTDEGGEDSVDGSTA